MRPLPPAEAQWIFPPSALTHTPSRDVLSLSEELAERKLVVDDMLSFSRRTGLVSDKGDDSSIAGRGVVTVGATLAHRFYMRRSFKDFPRKLVTPTIFFLAAKVEEQPVKLRYITNACLQKYLHLDSSKFWDPHAENAREPSEEYRRWERDILATEELVLEALCFDTRVEQPWPLLRRATKGFDGFKLAPLPADEPMGFESGSVNGGDDVRNGNPHSGAAESSAQAAARESASGPYPNGVNGNGSGHAGAGSANGKGKERASRLTEGVMLETAWVVLSESNCSPLAVLHPPQILAFAAFVLVLALDLAGSVPEALVMASELGWRFDLDVHFDEANGAVGPDLAEVEGRRSAHEFLILEGSAVGPFTRRFRPPPTGRLPPPLTNTMASAAPRSSDARPSKTSVEEKRRTPTPADAADDADDDLFGREHGGSPLPVDETAASAAALTPSGVSEGAISPRYDTA
ncbi:hypothetical protein JCM24511_05010 [Saitozyma sp. JCM 24511]|nr:hypothetical protein JCM24511_05010 [Saitozyma sp. JCM 24511]